MGVADLRLDIRARRAARAEILRLERAEQRLAGQQGVARQADGYFIVTADLGAVDVDLNDRGIAGERPPGVGAVLVGAGADENYDVGVADELAEVVTGRRPPHVVGDDAEG